MFVLGLSKLIYMTKYENIKFEVKSMTSSYSDDVYL